MEKYIKVQFDDNTLPIVYHDNYNLQALPYSMDRFQPMIPDKPEKVYSMLKCMLCYIAIDRDHADLKSKYL